MESVKRRAGRPRSFDPDAALEKALLLFWERGYEGASLLQLQEVTGLTAPALYRAFGPKERLFELAVRRYQDRYGFQIRDDLPIVEAVREYLHRAAREYTTEPGLGCLIATGMLATSPDAQVAAGVVRAERERALDTLRRRFALATANGELPAAEDTEGLARTIAAVIQGMSVQARDGATREELVRIADDATQLVRSRNATALEVGRSTPP